MERLPCGYSAELADEVVLESLEQFERFRARVAGAVVAVLSAVIRVVIQNRGRDRGVEYGSVVGRHCLRRVEEALDLL